ncbi:kynureninase [Amanita rubescens]|nr:kynureninase [Amanita rubescens]
MHSPLSTDFSNPTLDTQRVYLCGNSLGLLSNRSRNLVNQELNVWASRGVVGHFDHPFSTPWTTYTDVVTPLLAEIVGAKEPEVACMGTLTANLHLMMNSFYKPTPQRYKILCEAKAFPSDQYVFASQALAHGFDPATAVLEVSPREGEATLREEDILDIINKEGETIALVLFSGVQYYTGQYFPIKSITQAAIAQGCICGWDLAHAVGNVPLSLHDWGVDFAVWCSYKYLNSGPGGIAGIFIHEKWNDTIQPRHTGWWGHDMSTPQGFQQSNPCILALASLLGSLQIFKEVGMMAPIRQRSLSLTNSLDQSLRQSKYFVTLSDALSPQHDTIPGPRFTILTPDDPESRGAQLSLLFLPIGNRVMQRVFDYLTEHGPDVIRLSPAPLYNTIDDCDRAVSHLNAAFSSLFPTGMLNGSS